MKDEEKKEIKGTAFGICMMRTQLSLLPLDAGAIRYDDRTVRFEGVALECNPQPGKHTIEEARRIAADYPAFLRHMSEKLGDKNWHGFEFNICRMHRVDALLQESVVKDSPIKQIVFCGVGQDYRGLRYGKEILAHGSSVFELDLPPMLKLREQAKAKILEVNQAKGFDVGVPDTFMLPIDFDTQSVSDILLACSAFDPHKPTLYLWEGVSYYLTPEAMQSFLLDIFNLMKHSAPSIQREHRLFFDYLIDLPKLAAHGDVPAKAMLDMFHNSEPLRAFLDFNKVDSYLASVGLCVHQKEMPPEMYHKYQTHAQQGFCLTESPYFGMVVAKPLQTN